MTIKTFTQRDRDFFRREGYLRVSGLHTSASMKGAREKVLRELSRLRIWSAGKSGGSSLQSMPAFQQIAKLSSTVKVDLHQVLCTPVVLSAIAGLTGRQPIAEQGSQLLLSLAHQGSWSLDRLNWHVDIAAKPGDEIPGVQAFYLLADVVPHGGATLALARSHRLVDDVSSRLRASLRASVDMQEALRTFDVDIIEMSGRAGDVFLMDMRVLHTPSINATKNIRMMATTRFSLHS